ncbi:MAG TPA: SAM-dependent methyltransferase [Acidimicrobiales bacterium]|nr:SAM-dependent methyltransferase [Acidimicrobiales bacterium]
MRVLLSDGSGLTARQCATRLAAAGHRVEALTPDPLCLCRFTRHVARLHRVPAFGPDPLGWLDAALEVYRSGPFDVLLPTQEQVAVLSWAKDRLEAGGVHSAVPPFAAVAAVQDKVSASATLRRLGLPQPETAATAEGWDRFPAYVKDPIGTASGGVRKVGSRLELERAAGARAVLVQAAVEGPLLMCQSVFDHGSLVAFHANERTAEGAGGGASHKRGVSVPEVRRFFEVLGADLRWHGALSADVIVGDAGPLFIDVNPRLVEPQNAYASGVDLVGAMLVLATGGHPAPQTDGSAGVATHQLMLAVLGAAQHGRGRRGVVAELLHAARGTHDYRGSTEELTPLGGDPGTLLPLAAACAAMVVRPASWSWFASGSVSNYALSPEGWRQILEADPGDRRPRARRTRHARPSRTAALMAVQRGLESARPRRDRLFQDVLAQRFVPAPWRIALAASHLRPVRRAIEAAYDVVGGSGPRASAIARTRLIDDIVEGVAPSVGHVVILGAGYDTRPHRLTGLCGHTVFEVDQPGTQAHKQAALRRARIHNPDVVLVPVDFETDDLATALRRAGFSTGRPALVLWEGVTQYLSADAVDRTLAFIRQIAPGGSLLVFTYVDSAVLRDSATFPEAARWLRGVTRRGEPWIFGLSPAALASFLADRGFGVVDDMSTAEAGARYFGPRGRHEQGSGLYHVATASITPGPQGDVTGRQHRPETLGG